MVGNLKSLPFCDNYFYVIKNDTSFTDFLLEIFLIKESLILLGQTIYLKF